MIITIMIMIDKIQSQRIVLPSVFKFSRVHLIKQPKHPQIDHSTLNLGISLPNKVLQHQQSQKQSQSRQKLNKQPFFSNRTRNSVNYGSKQKLQKINRSSANIEPNKFDSIIQCRRNITQFQQSKNQIFKINIKNSLKNKNLTTIQPMEQDKSQKQLKKFIQENKIKFKHNFKNAHAYFDLQSIKNGDVLLKTKSKKNLQLSIHSIKSTMKKKSKFQKYSELNISELLKPIQEKSHQHKKRKSLGKKVAQTSIYGKKKTLTQQNDDFFVGKQKRSIFNRPQTELNIQFGQQLNPWQSLTIDEQKQM